MEIYNGKYCVYVHINKINGKIYVGQTGQNCSRRWREHGEGYKKSTYFYNAIQKYGWNNFDHEIIASNLTLEEANQFESLLIQKLDTINPDKGYNLTSGGHNFNFSEESIEKIKESSKIRWNKPEEREKLKKSKENISEESRNKMRESQIKRLSNPENHPMYGKHPSLETRNKMSKSAKERCTEEWRNKQKTKDKCQSIMCIETGIIYISIRECSRQTNIDRAHLARAAKSNGIKMAGKDENGKPFHWKLIDSTQQNDLARE